MAPRSIKRLSPILAMALKRSRRLPSIAECLPFDLLDGVFAHLTLQLVHEQALVLSACVLIHFDDKASVGLIPLVSAVKATQASIGNAILISRSWHESGTRAMYGRPFLNTRPQIIEFARTLLANQTLAQHVRRPIMMFFAKTVFPSSPARPPKHWWQKPQDNTYEDTLRGYTRALDACIHLTGVVYFTRQRARSYEFPHECLTDSRVSRILTISGCMTESFGFPRYTTLANIEELCATGFGLARSLPHMPMLRTLRLAKLWLDTTNYTGPLFAVGLTPQALCNVEMLDNDEKLVARVMDAVLGGTALLRLTLVGWYEAAALGRVLTGGSLLTSLAHVAVCSRAFSMCTSNARFPPSLQSLVVMRFRSFPIVATDLSSLVNRLEESECPALEEMGIVGALTTPDTEEADTISLNRVERWCNDRHVKLRLESLRGEDQEQGIWIHSHLVEVHIRTAMST